MSAYPCQWRPDALTEARQSPAAWGQLADRTLWLPPLATLLQVLMDFPQLTMTMPDGREESIMQRTTLVRAGSGARSGFTCTECERQSVVEGTGGERQEERGMRDGEERLGGAQVLVEGQGSPAARPMTNTFEACQMRRPAALAGAAADLCLIFSPRPPTCCSTHSQFPAH